MQVRILPPPRSPSHCRHASPAGSGRGFTVAGVGTPESTTRPWLLSRCHNQQPKINVAQLARATVSKTVGSWFESRRWCHAVQASSGGTLARSYSSRHETRCELIRAATTGQHFIWRGDGQHCKPRNQSRQHHHPTLPIMRQQRLHLRHSGPTRHRSRLGRNNPTMRELRGKQP